MHVREQKLSFWNMELSPCEFNAEKDPAGRVKEGKEVVPEHVPRQGKHEQKRETIIRAREGQRGSKVHRSDDESDDRKGPQARALSSRLKM
jgi:hypothetical protein